MLRLKPLSKTPEMKDVTARELLRRGQRVSADRTDLLFGGEFFGADIGISCPHIRGDRSIISIRGDLLAEV